MKRKYRIVVKTYEDGSQYFYVQKTFLCIFWLYIRGDFFRKQFWFNLNFANEYIRFMENLEYEKNLKIVDTEFLPYVGNDAY